MFDNLPSLRFQKILIEIFIKTISQAKPSFFLKFNLEKTQLFSRQKKRGGADIHQDF
jgi:hypothetical protein